MGLFDDTLNYPYIYEGQTTYQTISDNTNAPYSNDLSISYKYETPSILNEKFNNLTNYVNSLKNYDKYKEVIKCSPFFRATPNVYKHILG